MDYIYAVLLLHNGKKEITEANVKAVLTAAGLPVDDAKLKGLLASLKEISIAEAIEKASMPVAAAAGPAAEVKEEAKEEEVEVSEESAAEGLGSLFG